MTEIYTRAGIVVTAKEMCLLSLSLKLGDISTLVLKDILLPKNTNYVDKFNKNHG